MPTDCSKLHRVLTELALEHGSDPSVRSLDDVVERMKTDIPEITREAIADAIHAATTGHAKAASELADKLNDLKREARGDANLRKAIAELEAHLESGTLPESKRRSGSEVNADLKSSVAGLRKAISQSEPAVKERFEKSIDRLTERLQANDFAPRAAESRPLSKDLARLEYEKDKLARDVRQKIHDLKPRSMFQRAYQGANVIRTLMTTGEFSFGLIQGGFVTAAHPIRSALEMGKAFKAFVSDQSAYEFAKALEERPNAPLYAKAKLAITHESGPLSGMEEQFASNWTHRIIGLRNFERAGRTFLNEMRADSFDALAQGLARNAEPTLDEAKAIANFVNVATGRPGFGKLEPALSGLNNIFFAPRYVASRFMILAGQPFYRGSGSTRAAIAKEYARTMIGMAAVYGLAKAAGADITDDGKIRVGDTRIDLTAGLATQTKFLTRMGREAAERLGVIREDKRTDAEDTLKNFLRQKLAPIPDISLIALTGKDAIGRKTSATDAVLRHLTPITYGDVVQAIQSEGIIRGAALSIFAFFGANMNTYPDTAKEKAAKRSKKRLQPTS